MQQETFRNRRAGRGADIRREQRIWVGWRRRKAVPEPAGEPVEAPAGDGSPPASAPTGQPPLEKVARQVTEAEAIIARQRDEVFERRRNGEPAEDAEKILRAYQEALFEQRKHLAMLQNRHRRGL